MVPVDRLKFARETTKWADFKQGQINHTYIFYVENRKNVYIGHIPHGTKTVRLWSEPIDIDRKGRKFESIPIPDFAEEQIYGSMPH